MCSTNPPNNDFPPSQPTTARKRPPLTLLRRGGSIVPSPDVNSASSCRESVFSFHQNIHTSLLFGKNGVVALDGDEETPGYLSLHQDINRLLVLKWTPNTVLRPTESHTVQSTGNIGRSMSLKMEIVTHLHLHQKDISTPVTIVLIDADGIQQFSFKLMNIRQCLSFLNALEMGLSPLFRINPTLNSLNLTADCNEKGKLSNVERKIDVIFQIISFMSKFHLFPNRFPSSSTSSKKIESDKEVTCNDASLRETLAKATKAMKDQIISRAFYGWLSYSRHLRTIRTNLSTIVLPIFDYSLEMDSEVNISVNEMFWSFCRSEKTVAFYKQFLKRVYHCGIEHELRPMAWPYLLRLVEWHDDLGEDKLAGIRDNYHRDLEEWMQIEKELTDEGGVAGKLCHQDSDIVDVLFREYEPSAYSSSVSSDVFDETEGNLSSTKAIAAAKLFNKEFGLSLHRIVKDVDRCDRTTRFYSKKDNLESLRKIMCTFIYRRLKVDLDDGYVQGLCDLLAPLLVILRDDSLTLACFECLMKRMAKNFPRSRNNLGIEEDLNNFRYLVEVMDPELYSQLMRNVDYSFVVFYRWLLLDFKRELVYEDVFKLWEVVWAAEMICTRNFGLFFGLALLVHYRDILIRNEMDFTDVIKFFNEMAEKHNLSELLKMARKQIRLFQEIVHDKEMYGM